MEKETKGKIVRLAYQATIILMLTWGAWGTMIGN